MRLAAEGDSAIPFLREHLRPACEVDGNHLRKLGEHLDSKHFARQEAAWKELAKLGWQIEGTLQQTLQQTDGIFAQGEQRHPTEAVLRLPRHQALAGRPSR